MSNEIRETLVFRDGRGRLYTLPCGVLERYRVPADQRAEVDQAIAAEDVVHLGYPTSPDAPGAGASDRFPGLRLLGQWRLPDRFGEG